MESSKVSPFGVFKVIYPSALEVATRRTGTSVTSFPFIFARANIKNVALGSTVSFVGSGSIVGAAAIASGVIPVSAKKAVLSVDNNFLYVFGPKMPSSLILMPACSSLTLETNFVGSLPCTPKKATSRSIVMRADASPFEPAVAKSSRVYATFFASA